MAEFYLQRSITNNMDDLCIQDSIIKLDEAGFGGSTYDFPYYARETMQRYKHSKPELYKLILKMSINYDDCSSLATELIMDALNLSAKKLNVEISSRGKPDKIFFEGAWREVIPRKSNMLVLPGQVFESTSLKELSATYCIINKPISDSITCFNLVSLNLTRVTIGDGVMKYIISRCPLLEYLDLYECECLTKISLGKMQRNLKHCRVDHIQTQCFVNFFEEGLTQFPNLTSSDFYALDLEKNFFHDSMVKFPCLTDLSLRTILGFEGIVEISLPSLKYLEVACLVGARWVFNVPNIHKFNCSDYTNIPPLYISTSSNQWESAAIEFDCYGDHPRTWFLGLREFLQNLSVSKKISLSLSLFYSHDDQPCIGMLTDEDISGFPCIPVENLGLQCRLEQVSLLPSAFSNLVIRLLSTCRPNFITIEYCCHSSPKPTEVGVSVLELIRKSVTEQATWKCDLKQVTFEMLFKEEETRQWRPILWDDLIASVRLITQGFQVRLKLEWLKSN